MNTPKTVDHALLTIHVTLAVLWAYQGLVPKIIDKVIEEQLFWQFIGIQFISLPRLIELSGLVEIAFGVSFLLWRQSKIIHYLNIIAMLFFLLVVTVIYPFYFIQAFNPFVMNIAMLGLSVVALQLQPKHTSA